MNRWLPDEDLVYIRDLVRGHSGVVLDPQRSYQIEGALFRTARQEGYTDPAALVHALRSRPVGDLHTDVAEELITKQTWFFRDGLPFHALRDLILPALMKRRRDERRLTIWSAGCSSGQEPYSIALLIHTELTELLEWNLRILATDISRKMIGRVGEARYDRIEANRGLSRALLEDCFEEAEIFWTLKDEVRELVTRETLNLVADFPNMAPMDVIFLRNVLPQFDEETQEGVLTRVARLLAGDGYLVLGEGETPQALDPAFEAISGAGGSIFRLRDPA